MEAAKLFLLLLVAAARLISGFCGLFTMFVNLNFSWFGIALAAAAIPASVLLVIVGSLFISGRSN
jgi:hypothetical protein